MIKSKENRELLEKILDLAVLKRSGCKRFLGRHKSSLDGYIYRYSANEFPGSFSFYFLNAIYAALLKKNSNKKTRLKETKPDSDDLTDKQKREIDEIFKEKNIKTAFPIFKKYSNRRYLLSQLNEQWRDTIFTFSKGKDSNRFEIDKLINKYGYTRLIQMFLRDYGFDYLIDQAGRSLSMDEKFTKDGFMVDQIDFIEDQIVFKDGYATIKESEVKNIAQKTIIEFENILKNCENLKVKEKLLMPALVFHISILVKLSTPKYTELNYKDFIEHYINLVAPKEQEYVELRGERENFDKDQATFDSLSSGEFDQNYGLINSIRSFFPVLEKLRKREVPNYFSPREYTVYSSRNKTLLPKQFINQINELNAEKEKVEQFLSDAQKLTKRLKGLDEIPIFLDDSEKKTA